MKLELATGEAAEIVESDGDRVTLASSRAAPPGTPLALRSDSGDSLCVKVRNCRRQGEQFLIEGRWVSLTRGQREEIRKVAQGGESAP